jgi:ABC-2 type transport system permease protein
VSVLVRKEIRQAWRSFRLPALYIVLLFLAVLDPLSAKYMGEIISRFAQGITIIMPPQSAEQALATFISDIVEIGLLIIIAITMGSVAGEKATGVTTFIVTKPASRKSYVLAKLAVLAGGLVLGIAASTLVASLYTWTLLGPVSASRAALAATSVGLYAEFIMAATFAASMAVSGTVAAGGLGLAVLAVAGIAGSVLSRSRIGPYLPSTLMGNASLFLTGADVSKWTSMLLKPGLTTSLLSAGLLVAGFERFKRVELQ